ncbi:DUF5677 domain-containing protein [uncultured Salinisphaera sp.]|uniref:DUF5677 domain-containing protein n=1 Tax=uncultured Salinisphaera sp. TaxID=359372 RepID=UPI0032B1FD54
MSKEHQPVEVYRAAADALYIVSGMVLIAFARHECDTKNIIIRNFVARSARTLKSVFLLWDNQDYQNAWAIHRVLIDRMFHLHSLGEKNEFEVFDDWSFYEQYKAQNRVKSDELFKNQAVGWVYNLSEKQKERIRALEKNKPVWRRPKAAAVANDMGMQFLYKYGYDYASTHVHPMANDGQQDFFIITGLEPAARFPSNTTVISNTLLTASMILQDAMNYSSFKWRKIVWECISEIRSVMEMGGAPYQDSLLKLAEMSPGQGLCEPSGA